MILRPEKDCAWRCGVPHREILFPLIRGKLCRTDERLFGSTAIDYILPVANGDNAGILGCYLAKTLL